MRDKENIIPNIGLARALFLNEVLPDEMLSMILSFVHTEDLPAAMRTCRKLKHVISGDDFWRSRLLREFPLTVMAVPYCARAAYHRLYRLHRTIFLQRAKISTERLCMPDCRALACMGPWRVIAAGTGDTSYLHFRQGSTWARRVIDIDDLAGITVLAHVGEALYLGDEDGSLQWSEKRRGRWDGNFARFGELPGSVTALAVCGSYLYAGAEDGTLSVYAVRSLDCEATLNLGMGPITAIIGQARRCIAASSSGRVAVLRLTPEGSWKVFSCFDAHAQAISKIVLFQGLVITASADQSLGVWLGKDRTWTRLASLVGHTAAVTALCCGEHALFSGDASGRVRLWRCLEGGWYGEELLLGRQLIGMPICSLDFEEKRQKLVALTSTDIAEWNFRPMRRQRIEALWHALHEPFEKEWITLLRRLPALDRLALTRLSDLKWMQLSDSELETHRQTLLCATQDYHTELGRLL